MSMPPAGFGRAFDLSSLTKPKVEVGATSSDEATVENFMADYVGRSKEKPVVLLAYSPRSAATVELRQLMASIAKEDNDSWIFGAINADTQVQLVQALKITAVPFAIAFINEQPVALFDRVYPREQIVMVITKLFELAKEQGLNVQVQFWQLIHQVFS